MICFALSLLLDFMIIISKDQMNRDARKPVFGVSDQVRHKPVCAAAEDGYKPEISDLRKRGIVLSV